jgi:Domain of unknown function (DUF4184)
MPFTFSHAAAVLPFCRAKKIPVSVTGLIIGSMVPDFEFLFLLRESDYTGHLWPGILLFNIPAAIFCAFIFHLFVRNSLIVHLPLFLRRRFAAFLNFNWTEYFKQHYLAFIVCAAAGVATHIFIDAFTHKSGFMARPAWFFQAEIKLFIFPLPVYFILQLLTSLLGGLYICWYVLKMKKETGRPYNSRPVAYWFVFFIAVLVVLLLRFTVTTAYRTHEDSIIAATGSLLYALLLVSGVFYKKTGRILSR